MLSSLLSCGFFASAIFASYGAAVTTVSVNGTAAHSIPPLLCELRHLPVTLFCVNIPFSWTDV
jgi:hypothetical protein